MADEKIPASVACSEMTIGTVTLRVHVLDDGRRIVEQAGMDEVLEAMAAGSLDPADALRLAAWLKEAGYGRRH